MKWLLPFLCACSPPMSPCGPRTGVVTSVIDGDTIELQSGVRIRYLLSDTPETTGGKRDCFGPEAVARNKGLVDSQTVTLTYDEARCQDTFGRTLAYVSVGLTEVNATLVREGLACALFVSPAGQARREEFETLESEAKTARAGMWGQCTMVPCDK
jgi:micrococcal nuclease